MAGCTEFARRICFTCNANAAYITGFGADPDFLNQDSYEARKVRHCAHDVHLLILSGLGTFAPVKWPKHQLRLSAVGNSKTTYKWTRKLKASSVIITLSSRLFSNRSRGQRIHIFTSSELSTLWARTTSPQLINLG